MLEPIIDKRAAVQIPLVPAGITIQVRRGMLRHVVLFKWRGDVTDEQLMALRHGRVFVSRIRLLFCSSSARKAPPWLGRNALISHHQCVPSGSFPLQVVTAA